MDNVSLWVAQHPAWWNDIASFHSYYNNKRQSQRPSADLPPPPCYESLPAYEPASFPNTTHFTCQEVETALHNLPNNKASGMDGLTYESLKTTQSCQILTTILNVCLENRGSGLGVELPSLEHERFPKGS